MSDWNILGINPTNDQIQIRKAYSAKLKLHHPEEDPHGFMKIRAAYESCLANSKYISKKFQNENKNLIMIETTNIEPTNIVPPDIIPLIENSSNKSENLHVLENVALPKDILVEKEKASEDDYIYKNLSNIYNDIFKRVDETQWKKFFFDLSLLELTDLGKNSHKFFNKNNHLPFNIWKIIESELKLSENYNFKREFHSKYYYGFSFECLHQSLPSEIDFHKYFALINKAFINLSDKNYSNALQIALKAQKLYGKDPFLYRIIGLIYFKSKQYNDAISAFSQFLEYSPKDVDSLVYRGNSYINIGKLRNAKSDLKKAMKLSENPDIIVDFAKCLALMKSKKAIIFRNKAIYRRLPNIELDLLLYKSYVNFSMGKNIFLVVPPLPSLLTEILFKMKAFFLRINKQFEKKGAIKAIDLSLYSLLKKIMKICSRFLIILIPIFIFAIFAAFAIATKIIILPLIVAFFYRIFHKKE